MVTTRGSAGFTSGCAMDAIIFTFYHPCLAIGASEPFTRVVPIRHCLVLKLTSEVQRGLWGPNDERLDDLAGVLRCC